MNIKQTLLVSHIDGCHLAGEWVLPKYTWLKRDTLHRRNNRASNGFLVFDCNDSDCPARLAVLLKDIIRTCGIGADRRHE